MAPRKRPPQPSKPTVGGQALRDGVASAAFLFGAAAINHLCKPAAPLLGLSPPAAGLALILLLLIVLGAACERAGGAVFNPANNAFLFALGKGGLREHTLRTVAQAVGGIAGALLARALLPAAWTQDLSNLAYGLRPGVGLLEGAACEFVLGSLLSFAVLWSGELQSGFLKLWLPLVATVLAVKAGEGLTGPSLNPVFSFTWTFQFQAQSLAEHLLVFWAAPLASGLFGGWAFLGWKQWAAERAAAAPRRQQRGKQQRHNGAKAD